MIIETALATLITNVVTQFIKTKKPENMSPAERKKRKKTLRFFTAAISLITIIFTYFMVGGEIPMDTLSGNIETIVAFGLTFIGSQGTYFLAKERKAE